MQIAESDRLIPDYQSSKPPGARDSVALHNCTSKSCWRVRLSAADTAYLCVIVFIGEKNTRYTADAEGRLKGRADHAREAAGRGAVAGSTASIN
jgi:hypothetical protein